MPITFPEINMELLRADLIDNRRRLRAIFEEIADLDSQVEFIRRESNPMADHFFQENI